MRKESGVTNVSQWWLLMYSVFCLLPDSSCTEIFQASSACNNTVTPIWCDLKNKDGKLLGTNWEDKGFHIVNGKSLTILPQCNTGSKQLLISNTTNIVTVRDENRKECKVELRLESCTATKLYDLFSLINMKQSTIGDIKLRVDQFHILEGSSVRDMDFISTGGKSSIIDSTVDSVNRMEIRGQQLLDISRSHLKNVKKLIYNSNYSKPSYIREKTTIDHVSANGFEMFQGILHLEYMTINSLSSESIVISGGNMVLKNVSIKAAYSKSIVMKGQGSISFLNVTIVDHFIGQKLNIENKGNSDVWPVAVILAHNSSLSVPLSMTIGIVIGVIFSVILIFIIIKLKGKNSVLSCENKRKSKMNYITTREHSPDVNSKPPCESPPKVFETNDTMEEDYDDLDPSTPKSPTTPTFNYSSDSQNVRFSSINRPNEDYLEPISGNMPYPQTPNAGMQQPAMDEKNPKPLTPLGHQMPFGNKNPQFPAAGMPTGHQPPFGNKNPQFPASGMTPGHKTPFGNPAPAVPKKPSDQSFLHSNTKRPVPPKPPMAKYQPGMTPVQPSNKLPGKLPVHEMESRFGQSPYPPQVQPPGNFGHHMEEEEDDYDTIQ